MLDIIIFLAYIGLVLGVVSLGAMHPLFVAPLAALAVMIPAAVFSGKK